jgi:hypothetical protein
MIKRRVFLFFVDSRLVQLIKSNGAGPRTSGKEYESLSIHRNYEMEIGLYGYICATILLKVLDLRAIIAVELP